MVTLNGMWVVVVQEDIIEHPRWGVGVPSSLASTQALLRIGCL